MLRVLLVDDSPSVRHVITERLSARGYDVQCAPDPLIAAELALSRPPDVVVTDMWMPGVSGVQLCRLLRAEPRTARVPVVLVTGDSQRRSRFWAKTAGAVAYVSKDDPAALFAALERIAIEYPPVAPASMQPASRTPMQHRLFRHLDLALFESVVAGEIRSLAHDEGDVESVFRGLTGLLSEAAGYSWLALQVSSPSRVFLHAHPENAKDAELELRATLDLAPTVELSKTLDGRALSGPAAPAITAEVFAMGKVVGSVVFAPNARGASRDDRDLIAITATELGGPLRIVALVEQTRQLAMTDPLTGLMNRRAFADVLAQGMAAFVRHASVLSIMLIDIDHFKLVNDVHGHDGGDAVLVSFAKLLRDGARKSDFVARWGGEELIVGLAHTASTGALFAAERVRRRIADHQFELPNGAVIKLTASIGVATVREGDAPDALISRADSALYRAKSLGRNRCEAADDESA